MSNTDAWKLDSGLRSDMVLSVMSAYFAYDADYQGGKQLLLFLIGVDESGEPVDHRMSVGGDWTTPDGGKTIVHPTKKFVNRNSIYGHWITSALEIPDLATILYERGAPTSASVWEGLILHLTLQTLHFGKNIDDLERLMVAEFFGQVDTTDQVPPRSLTPTDPYTAPTAPTFQPTQPTQPTQPIQPKVPGQGEFSFGPLTSAAPSTTIPNVTAADRVAAARQAASQNAQPQGSPLYQEMMTLAAQSPDFESFVGAALSRDDVLSDDELAVQVADQGGIWTLAHQG